MGQIIHFVPNFQKDVPIFGGLLYTSIFNYNVFREVTELDVHVFVPRHKLIEIEILDINCHEFGPWGGHHTLEEQLYCK